MGYLVPPDLRELLGCVLREHSDHHAVHNLELCAVQSGDLDEDVGGVEGDFGVVTVDDRGKRADGSVRIVDNRVDGRVTDDVQVFAQLLVLL